MDRNRIDISKWIEDRIAFIDAVLLEATADNNYGKQVYLNAKREAYEELLLELLRGQQKAS